MKVATLTPNEKRIVTRLKNAKASSIFYDMMRLAFVNGDVSMIRQLISDIKSQAFDAPDETMAAIGFKTYLMVINL